MSTRTRTITRLLRLAAIALSPVCAHAQVFSLNKEQMIVYTAENPFDRFADGRPKVPDELLEKVKTMLIEEAYGVVRGKGFVNQFSGDWKILNVTPSKKLVGRVFTAQFMPTRPDVENGMNAEAAKKGLGRLR